jgi:hypothetical protein
MPFSSAIYAQAKFHQIHRDAKSLVLRSHPQNSQLSPLIKWTHSYRISKQPACLSTLMHLYLYTAYMNMVRSLYTLSANSILLNDSRARAAHAAFFHRRISVASYHSHKDSNYKDKSDAIRIPPSLLRAFISKLESSYIQTLSASSQKKKKEEKKYVVLHLRPAHRPKLFSHAH